jgi:hypothetical protein
MNAPFVPALEWKCLSRDWLVQLRDVSDYSNEAMNLVTQVDLFRPGILACYLPYMDVYRLVYTEHIIT